MAVKAWVGVWELQASASFLTQLEGQGCTAFCFADNLAPCCAAHARLHGSVLPELRKLLWWLRPLELKLSLHLEVVCVPGCHMISQQAGSLS